MRNLLLEGASNFENFIPLIIIGVFVVIAIVVFLLMTRKGGKKKGKKGVSTTENVGEIDYSKSMALRIPFLNAMENNFMYNFQKVLPDEYVVYPKVNMKSLINPYNNVNFYNAVSNRVLDFVVFMKKNMQPVVVIDIHDRTGVQKSIEEDDKHLSMALKNVNLPVVEFEVRQDYVPAELLSRFLDALDPLAIANLKKNRERYK
ncbi:MAG: DUF2726 domain-containing protein [Clostridia bacterium]|nr:DUF2726 domain-containing protein [Clostridia bacterium]